MVRVLEGFSAPQMTKVKYRRERRRSMKT